MIRTETLGMAYGASELLLAAYRRSRRSGARSRDRGTLPLVWITILAAMGAAVWFANSVELGRYPVGGRVRGLALGILIAGVGLRVWAISTLGRFFTVDVAIHEDHRLVTRGPYRWLRHPSYTGVLLAFLGIGLSLGSWPGLLALVVPVLLALGRRISVEERVLGQHFGPAWQEHRARTWRLMPWVW